MSRPNTLLLKNVKNNVGYDNTNKMIYRRINNLIFDLNGIINDINTVNQIYGKEQINEVSHFRCSFIDHIRIAIKRIMFAIKKDIETIQKSITKAFEITTQKMSDLYKNIFG